MKKFYPFSTFLNLTSLWNYKLDVRGCFSNILCSSIELAWFWGLLWRWPVIPQRRKDNVKDCPSAYCLKLYSLRGRFPGIGNARLEW